jgi:hypothetical protein
MENYRPCSSSQNVLGGIGNTPLAELRNVVPPGSARVVTCAALAVPALVPA